MVQLKCMTTDGDVIGEAKADNEVVEREVVTVGEEEKIVGVRVDTYLSVPVNL